MPGKYLLPALLFLSLQSQAQYPQLDQHPTGNPFFVNTANGKSMLWGPGYEVSGSPFFNDSYLPADITLMSGEIYHNIKVKFNLYDHTLQYLLPDDTTEQATTSEVKSVKFLVPVPEAGGFAPIILDAGTNQLNKNGGTVYAVLDSGKISLLQDVHITWTEGQGYGTATIKRNFLRKEVLMVRQADGKTEKLDKSKSSVLALFGDKQSKVDSYITTYNLSTRSLADLVQIFHYYNSL